jgi:RES domain
MKPLPMNWGSEGRANPRGISYLYLAMNKTTALAEIRPWIGSKVFLAPFTTVRNLKIVDLSISLDGINRLPKQEHANIDVWKEGTWRAISSYFARPVSRDDDVSDYIPTQVLSEFLKTEKYAGIAFSGSLDPDGVNIALFNPDDAKVGKPAICKIDSIKFQFSELSR